MLCGKEIGRGSGACVDDTDGVPASDGNHEMWKSLAGAAWPVPEPRDAGANGLILCLITGLCLAGATFRELCHKLPSGVGTR